MRITLVKSEGAIVQVNEPLTRASAKSPILHEPGGTEARASPWKL